MFTTVAVRRAGLRAAARTFRVRSTAIIAHSLRYVVRIVRGLAAVDYTAGSESEATDTRRVVGSHVSVVHYNTGREGGEVGSHVSVVHYNAGRES